MSKKSMSVREMGEILGLKKVESYWLVHKEYFTTVTVYGKMRVLIDSFEEWYANQLHYKKVNGEAPGSNMRAVTWSIGEVAAILGIAEATVYNLLKKRPFEYSRIDNRTRIDKVSFEAWLESQTRYKKIKEVE